MAKTRIRIGNAGMPWWRRLLDWLSVAPIIAYCPHCLEPLGNDPETRAVMDQRNRRRCTPYSACFGRTEWGCIHLELRWS